MQFTKEKDMELPEALRAKVHRAIAEQKLAGFVSYSEDEYKVLLAYTKEYSRALAYGGRSFLYGDTEIHFVTLVETTKRWKCDDNSDKGFWRYIIEVVLDGGYDPKLWGAYKDLIRGLAHNKKILMANTADKYYATLLMHALAPYNSINSFFDLTYNIYKNDLNFTKPDHEICKMATECFCAVAQGLGGKNVGITIGSEVYGIQIGLRSMALGPETRHCFTFLLERVLHAMHLLYHGNTISDDSYVDDLVNKWWKCKEDPPHPDLGPESYIPPTPKQNISVKFIRKGTDVYLCIPPIRFARGEYPRLWLYVYTGNHSKPILSKEIFTRIGEITITSIQQDIKLNDLLHEALEINLRVEIIENEVPLFDKNISRDFILFDNEKELTNRILKADNYFIYSLSIDTLQTPAAISLVSSNLYNIYPVEGEILSGENRQVFFTGESATGTTTKIQLIGNSGICKWTYKDRACMVFGNCINLLVPPNLSVNSLALRVNGNRTLLSNLSPVSENGFCIYDITDLIPLYVPCELIVYSHLKERELIHTDIISIQKLRIRFSMPIYYGDENRNVRISVETQYKDLTWDPGEETASCTLCKGCLEIIIPQIKWRIDLGDWHYAPISKVIWYKDQFNNGSLFELQSPIAINATKLYCIGDGAAQEIPLNASSKFEIGKYIFANEGRRKLVFFLKLNESGERKELFEVTTVERFTQEPPFIIENEKLCFIGDRCFIGGNRSHFNICLKRIGREEMTKKSTDLINGFLTDVDEGIYWIKVSSPSTGLFSSNEKVLWEGEFVFGNREKLNLNNLVLKINPISGPTMGDSWKQLSTGYYITNFVREEDSDSYLARLHYRNLRDEKSDVYGFSECRIVIISSIALQVFVKDSSGDYSSKFKCDERGNLYSPQSDEVRTATNYHFIEVKHV